MAKRLTCATPQCGGQRFEKIASVCLPVDGPFGGIRNRDQVLSGEGAAYVSETRERTHYRCLRCAQLLGANLREAEDDEQKG